MTSGPCIALIVAAGSGERFGGERPKQYMDLSGSPVLRRSIEAFLGHPDIDAVQVVYSPAHDAYYRAAIAGLDLPPPVAGGSTRQASVLLGLEKLAETGAPARVLIHDAARPMVDAATISRVVRALDDQPGAIAAVPVIDTLKRAAEGVATATIDRSGLWAAQTPQGFRFPEILAAHRAAAPLTQGGAALTDDAAVAEKAGLPVTPSSPSNPDNMKITMIPTILTNLTARLLGHALMAISAPAWASTCIVSSRATKSSLVRHRDPA